MVKWKKVNKKMAGLLLGVMMLFTASTTAFAYVDESAEASKVETSETSVIERVWGDPHQDKSHRRTGCQMAILLNMGGSCSVCVPLYITKRSEAVLQWGKRKNIKKNDD